MKTIWNIIYNIFKWLRNNAIEIFVLLFIIVIALLIIDFGVKINPNTVNILVSIAAIASTFLLYLSFRESQRNNKLVIYADMVKQYKVDINLIKRRSDQLIFNDEEHIKINSSIIFSRTKFKNSNFPATLLFYLRQIQSLYDKYFEYKEGTYSISPGDRSEQDELNTAILILKDKTIDYTIYCDSIINKCHEIEHSRIDPLHKKNLIIELIHISYPFWIFVKSINYNSELKKLLELNIYYFNDDGNSHHSEPIVEKNFLAPFDEFNTLMKKYDINY